MIDLNNSPPPPLVLPPLPSSPSHPLPAPPDKIPNIHHNEITRQIVTTDIWRNCYTIDKDKTCKTDGIKTIFHNKSWNFSDML